MRDNIFMVIGIVVMIVLGFVTATGAAQDLVWLLVPGLALVIALLAASKILR